MLSPISVISCSKATCSKGAALHAFEATEASHIALSCGQRVQIIEERDDGWSYGEVETGERGTFPTSYVQLDGLDSAPAELSLAPKLSRSDSFTTIASRRASMPHIAAAQSIGYGLRGHLAKTLSANNAAPDVGPWDSVSCFGAAQEEPGLRPLGDSGGSGLGLTSDEVANLLGSIELKNAEQLQHWARTEPITGGDLEQLLFLERAEADAILLNAGLANALHRKRLLSQVKGWSQCGVPPRLIEASPPPAPVQAVPPAAPIRTQAHRRPAEEALGSMESGEGEGERALALARALASLDSLDSLDSQAEGAANVGAPPPQSQEGETAREAQLPPPPLAKRGTGSGASLGGGDAAVTKLFAMVATGAVKQSSECEVLSTERKPELPPPLSTERKPELPPPSLQSEDSSRSALSTRSWPTGPGREGAAAGAQQPLVQPLKQHAELPHAVRSVQQLIAHWKRIGDQFVQCTVQWQRAMPTPPVFVNSFICGARTSPNNSYRSSASSSAQGIRPIRI